MKDTFDKQTNKLISYTFVNVFVIGMTLIRFKYKKMVAHSISNQRKNKQNEPF